MAHPGLLGGVGRPPCTLWSADPAGWRPRSAQGSPPEPALYNTILALLTRCRQKAGILSLERLVLIEALSHTVVVPRECTTFGYWAWSETGVAVPLRKSKGSLHNGLGLRTLDKSCRLFFDDFEGDHLAFDASFWESSVLSQ